jgi:cell division protein FtsQ
MARKDEEFYRGGGRSASGPRSIAVSRETGDDASEEELDQRLLDPDEEEESRFLRAPTRVPVRRGAVTRRTRHRLRIALIALGAAAVFGGAAGALYAYGTGSWRFRLDSSDNLEIAGTHNISRAQVLDVFGSDIGRNVFFIPLADRKKQLEQLPWVQSAAVMRLLPNRLSVQINERTPVAFLRMGSRASLIDANGVVMEMPGRNSQHYSFPIIVGTQRDEPLSTRAARMKTFMQLVQELDSTGAHYSQALSEVDLTDPEDVKATFGDSNGAVLVHLGDKLFLERYKIYLAHVNEWRQQFPHMDSVDLRYDREVIVTSSSQTANGSAVPKPKRVVIRAASKRH